jgi:Glycerophosphoryl diester phosphodiesterase family
MASTAGPARRVSRRAVLGGGLGIAALAVTGTAVPMALNRDRHREPGGMRVSELVAAPGFSIGHHGASADWPEMSMEGYQQAVRLGVDALEISLARSADGVWFGLHDATLDRTSGTSGFVASEHPWSEIQRYQIRPTGAHDTSSAPQPYLSFPELVAAYAGTHTIFVDPKAAPGRQYPELLALMDAAGSKATDSFVAKGYCATTGWAKAAHARGYRTWGYYYGKGLTTGRNSLAATQASWDLLGLDVAAPAGAWASMLALGKPVVGHIVASGADARQVRDRGARGLMISAVREVLG